MHSSFDTFFETATGHLPFPYQRRFAESATLPALLRAETGAGKTATAVLGWLWRRRFADTDVRRTTPRRLVFCLPMRSLVSQTESAVKEWRTKLGLTDDVQVHALLGGAVSVSWEEHPEADCVLIGTQDQLLSRALNRGYAMSRYRWSVHFALLNNDALWVMDETQLMGVGLSTSVQLQHFGHPTFGPRHTLWMSATLDEGLLRTVDLGSTPLDTQHLGDDDLKDDFLAKRLGAIKRLAQAPEVFEKKDEDYAKRLAPVVLEAHRANGGRTLVIVNRVSRAVELTRRLRDQASDVETLVLHSRFRPVERKAVEEAALDATFSGILVATQAVEAGVDISSRTLFTELAPWSSLVQRFGRCNRYGECADGADVFWIDLPDDEKLAAPYAPEEQVYARGLLQQHTDVGPSALAADDRPKSPTGPVLRRRDLDGLFDTTGDLSGFDLDVSRYIRDAGSREIQVAWRDWEGARDGAPPKNESARLALARDELCRVPLGAFDKLTKSAAWWIWDPLARVRGKRGAWVRGRRVVPGSTVLVAASAGGYHQDQDAPERSLGFTGDRRDRPAPVAPNGSDDAVAVEADDDDPDAMIEPRFYVSLQDHSLDVRSRAVALRAALEELGPEVPWDAVVEAAHWHDLGKVHPAWQAMITSNHEAFPDHGPWAKRPRDVPSPKRIQRRFFRHELASALAYLAHDDPDDLVAYLIAAHHGKVRTAIRSRPQELPDREVLAALGHEEGADVRLALGLYDGEALPAADLGEGLTTNSVVLDLSPMALGGGGGRSWVDRVAALLDQYGPYRLALLESLVRVADWRASSAPERLTPAGEVTDA